MKRFALLVFICVLSFGAIEAPAIILTPENVNMHTDHTNMPYKQYLKFYIIDEERINIIFKQMSEDDERKFERSLTKEEKQDYKYTQKVQKLIDKGDWNEVFYKYEDFFPAYIQYYNLCLKRKNYHEAIRILNKIKNVDKNHQIFSSDVINITLGRLYLDSKQYQTALDYFKSFEYTDKDAIYAAIAECYFYMNDNNSALTYIKKIKNPTYDNQELLYSIYIGMQNYTQAHKIAIELAKLKYNYTNFMKAQSTAPNDAKKLQYCYQARSATMNENEINEVNKIIVELEQKKLEKQISALKQFIKVPSWSDIKSQLPENVSTNEICSKQDEFYRTANEYLIKYSGQNLTNAFNSLNQDYVNYIQTKKIEYAQEQQALRQQQLEEEQARAMYIQQLQLQQQQLEHYRRMQRIYYLTRPYDDFSMPPWF